LLNASAPDFEIEALGGSGAESYSCPRQRHGFVQDIASSAGMELNSGYNASFPA